MKLSHPGMPKILFLEACNFVNAPLGGQLTGARMLMRAIGERLALAGWTDDPNAPIGKWHTRVIDGVPYDFFATDYVPKPHHRKPLIPARAKSWWLFKRYGNAMLSCGIRNIMTREPTVMMALPFKANHNVCFWFAGIEPALSVSRYGWAKPLATVFDKAFLRKLKQHSRAVLAAADDNAINGLRLRAGALLDGVEISFFPTRVDTTLFHPGDRQDCRKALGLPPDALIAITTGRLHRAKGWSFLLDAFEIFQADHPNAELIFIGDGGDRVALEQRVAEKGLKKWITLAGQQAPERLALYLQASDLFIMGSEKEGWSTSLLEALASALPIVSTRFSSAANIVNDGINGFVVDRNPSMFARAMETALTLRGLKEYSLAEVEKYALSNLAENLSEVWQLSKSS